MLSAYNSENARRNLAGYLLLGALTPEQAADTSFPQSDVTSRAGFNQHVRDCIVQATSSGAFACFDTSGCTGQPAPPLQLFRQGATIALSVGTAAVGIAVAAGAIAAATGAIIGAVTLGIGAIIGLFPMIFAHHAAAIAREQKIICASVPAANNYLSIIDQALASGAASPQQAIQALQSLLSDFRSTVAPIMKNDSSHCNAACVWVKELTAIVAYKSSVYQDLADQQASAAAQAAQQAAAAAAAQAAPPPPTAAPDVAPGSGSAGSGPLQALAVSSGSTMVLPSRAPAAAPASSSNWLGIAALLVGGFFVVRAL
jgi:hypothetical protein